MITTASSASSNVSGNADRRSAQRHSRADRRFVQRHGPADRRLVPRHGTVERRSAQRARPLASFVAKLQPHWQAEWAWKNYRDNILALSRAFALRRLCEIGGGRDPFLTPAQAAEAGVQLTINDISATELACAPAGLETACFDIAGDLKAAGITGERYDLMFSRMVFEHVRDVEQAWRNVHTLLAPGGVALAFFPTLYALPFTANHLMPEWLSRSVLKVLYPERKDGGGDPKFPAHYDHCFGDDATHRDMLSKIGFQEVVVVPFWGSGYFKGIPGIFQADNAFNAFAARRNWRTMTTHAYVLARK